MCSSQSINIPKPSKSTRSISSATQNSDSISKNTGSGFNQKATIDLYKIFNVTERDTVFIDTTLSVFKDYKYNYLQKDNFGLLPFANLGQTYNTLAHYPTLTNALPLFGARARHFNYYEKEDIKYYQVPTPWTRLTYKTAFQQGQLLDAFFTVNLSKQFNISLAYKGMRSIGNYQHAITSTGNFRLSTSYNSKDETYQAKAHIVTQDLFNEENGGLTNADVDNFISGEEDFLDREVFDPNFENADNILKGKRFYLNHSYAIIKPDSTTTHSLRIKNTLEFEDKFFEYNQTTAETQFFGAAFQNIIRDRATLENFQTSLGVDYNNNTLGQISFGINYNNINYGYIRITQLNTQNIPNRIKSNFFNLQANYAKQLHKFQLHSNAALNLSNTFKGYFLNNTLQYKLNNDVQLNAQLNFNSVLPNYNHLLNQSNYVNYNWYNLNSFQNINTQQLAFNVASTKWANINISISNIDNYTYFAQPTETQTQTNIKPQQYNKPLQHISVKVQREFSLGKFFLNNTVMYQKVNSDQSVLNVPTFITRNTLYFSSPLFKKAMKLQTGVTLNYFTAYNMDGYNPLLAEFFTQNNQEIGNFPRLDFFINAKIRQTRIFLKAEHFNASFTGYNYFSAPNQPYRDFAIRFGLVWDFFL